LTGRGAVATAWVALRSILVVSVLFAAVVALASTALSCGTASAAPDLSPAELESSDPAEERSEPLDSGEDPIEDEAGYSSRARWGGLALSAATHQAAFSPHARSPEPGVPPPRA